MPWRRRACARDQQRVGAHALGTARYLQHAAKRDWVEQECGMTAPDDATRLWCAVQATDVVLEVGDAELAWSTGPALLLQLQLCVDPVRVSLPADGGCAGDYGGGAEAPRGAGLAREPVLAINELSVGIDLRIVRCEPSHCAPGGAFVCLGRGRGEEGGPKTGPPEPAPPTRRCLRRGAVPLRCESAAVRLGAVTLAAGAHLLPALAALLRTARPRLDPRAEAGRGARPGPQRTLPTGLLAAVLPERLEISLPLLRCSVGAALAHKAEPGGKSDPSGKADSNAPAAAGPAAAGGVGVCAEARNLRLTGAAALGGTAAGPAEGPARAAGRGGPGDSEAGVERAAAEAGAQGSDGREAVAPLYRAAVTVDAVQVRRQAACLALP